MQKNVDHPAHYNQGNIECIDAMIAAFGKDAVAEFCRCNAFKYIWRSPYKGKEDEDIEKAIWYEDKFNELKGIKPINIAEQMRSIANNSNSLKVILEEIHNDIREKAIKGIYEMRIGKDYCHSFLKSNQCNYIVNNRDFARVLRYKLEQEGFETTLKDYDSLLLTIKWYGNNEGTNRTS